MRKSKNEHAGKISEAPRAYKYLGAHREGTDIVFRVWAPNALSAFIVGDFNLWDESCEMALGQGGVFEGRVATEKIKKYGRYKFKLVTESGTLYRSDPCGLFFEQNEELSTLFFESSHIWRDSGWLAHRAKNYRDRYSLPMNIYELHLGSWRKKPDGSAFSYAELAPQISQYAKELGYTHIQLLPIADHTGDPREDRRAIGLFSPSSEHGTPDEFRAFVDHMHRSGIGVIFDLGSLSLGECRSGLREFDGTQLYECADGADVRFDISKKEVREYLISNVLFWADEFHADGLFLGSVSSMLYPDAEKISSRPNVYGNEKAPDAVKFFREINAALKAEYPDVFTVAKESSAWSNVTGTENGGLGFDFKWNLGWTGDTLQYAKTDPYFRSKIHDRLTFPPVYSFAEKYILPIPHTELLRQSLIAGMHGDYRAKFAGVRLFEAYKLLFPGKKLSFAGTEIGQFDPFEPENEVEWFLLGYDMHAKLKKYFAELNHFYLLRPELWENDISADGFKFISSDQSDISVIAFERSDKSGKKLFAVFNFTPVTRRAFDLEVTGGGMYREIFNSDRTEFGGEGVTNPAKLRATDENGKYSIRMILPPLGCAIFEKI